MQLRKRIDELEGLYRSRERELERLQRTSDAAAAAAASQALELQEALRRAEDEVGPLRNRAVAAETTVKARTSDVARLQKLLDSTRASEFEFSSKQLQAEEAARLASDEAVSLRQQLVASQGGFRAKEADIARLVKAAEAAKAVECDWITRHQQVGAWKGTSGLRYRYLTPTMAYKLPPCATPGRYVYCRCMASL